MEETRAFVDVGSDANAMTKYGFQIPNYIYHGEMPTVLMTVDNIIPTKWYQALGAVIKNAFGYSMIKAPNKKNYNTLVYRNHTYDDLYDSAIIRFIQEYWLEYFVKPLAKAQDGHSVEEQVFGNFAYDQWNWIAFTGSGQHDFSNADHMQDDCPDGDHCRLYEFYNGAFEVSQANDPGSYQNKTNCVLGGDPYLCLNLLGTEEDQQTAAKYLMENKVTLESADHARDWLRDPNNRGDYLTIERKKELHREWYQDWHDQLDAANEEYDDAVAECIGRIRRIRRFWWIWFWWIRLRFRWIWIRWIGF